MKREFGKKLIEEFLPRWDLTHVIDTSGAYIPGHGTPTVILFGRNRAPVAATVRAVLGIRGEPPTPDDPAEGPGLVGDRRPDRPARARRASSSASPTCRASAFSTHPWSIGGGGAAELKELLDERCEHDARERRRVDRVRGDHAARTTPSLQPHRLRATRSRPAQRTRRSSTATRSATGLSQLEQSRSVPVRRRAARHAAMRSDESLDVPVALRDAALRSGRRSASTTRIERVCRGTSTRCSAGDGSRTPLSIAFAFVATHNHFVLDRGGKVFKQSAPVIKLPAGRDRGRPPRPARPAQQLDRLLLDEAGVPQQGGARRSARAASATRPWEQFYEFDGTKLQAVPASARRARSTSRGASIACARELRASQPASVVAHRGRRRARR